MNILRWIILVLLSSWAVHLFVTSGDHLVGHQAPPFEAKTSTGTMSLETYSGQYILLNFWASWCPPCLQEMPSLQEFSQKMAGKNLTVVGISVDDTEPPALAVVKDYHITFPIAYDFKGDISNLYHTSSIPESFLISPQGVILKKYSGSIEWMSPRVIQEVEEFMKQ